MLSQSIMGHPSRQKFIDALTRRLPDAEVVLDRENDRWETGRRALLTHVDTGSDHALIVQDDAILCRNFVRSCEVVAEAAGTERPVALYTGKVRPHQFTVTPAVRHARLSGIPWLEMAGPWWGVAIILPTAHIPAIVEWGDENASIRNYDRRISAWYERQGVMCWYTVPSLVDHRPVAENPSLIAGRDGNRRAHWFVGEEDSGLGIDWSKPPLRLGTSFAHRKTGRHRLVPTGSPRHRRLTEHPAWEEAA